MADHRRSARHRGPVHLSTGARTGTRLRRVGTRRSPGRSGGGAMAPWWSAVGDGCQPASTASAASAGRPGRRAGSRARSAWPARRVEAAGALDRGVHAGPVPHDPVHLDLQVVALRPRSGPASRRRIGGVADAVDRLGRHRDVADWSVVVVGERAAGVDARRTSATVTSPATAAESVLSMLAPFSILELAAGLLPAGVGRPEALERRLALGRAVDLVGGQGVGVGSSTHSAW